MFLNKETVTKKKKKIIHKHVKRYETEKLRR